MRVPITSNLTDVIASLLAEEVKRNANKRGGSSSTARVLYANKQKGKKEFKKSSNINGNTFGSSMAKKKGNCNWCRIPGHYERECRKKLAGEPRRPAPESNVTMASSTSTKPTVLVSCASNIVNEQNAWYIDSRATHHACHDKDLFYKLQLLPSAEKLTVGNDSMCLILGTGNVKLRNYEGKEVILTNVLYSPDMTKNLISVSKVLKSPGLRISFTSKGCKVTNTAGITILEACLKDALYCVCVTTAQTSISVNVMSKSSVGTAATSMLWHARLGHVNETKLKTLHTSAYYRHQVPEIAALQFCDACALGKIKQTPFAKESSFRATQLLELVHTDLCGPISKPSHGGAHYFMPFVDDLSRMTHTFFLQSKSQALECFCSFLTTAERQTGLKLKQIRTNGGGEFTSRDWHSFCDVQGIKHQVTVPYTSQMNGVAENKHQVLQYQARTMLLFAQLPTSYWAEAVDIATYIINRLPSSKTGGCTPYELWTGHKPSIAHLRIFGSPCYAYIPEHKRSKFDARAKKLILVGYSNGLKSYKLFDPKTRTARYARSVIVHEAALLLRNQQPTFGLAESRGVTLNVEQVDEDQATFEQVTFEADSFTTSSASVGPSTTNTHKGINTNTSLQLALVSTTSSQDVQSSEDTHNFVDIPDLSFTHESVSTGTPVGESEDVAETVESEPESPVPLRRSQRSRPVRENWIQPPFSPSNYMSQSTHVKSDKTRRELPPEPLTYAEAMRGPESDKWRQAAIDEYNSLIENQTWKLEPLPLDRKPIEGKWIFRRKLSADGSIERYKARFVVRGFKQIAGVNYIETELFSPVVRNQSIRFMLALSAELDIFLEHMDVCTAFLNGELKEVVYIRQPEGFADADFPEMFCRLLKALCGLNSLRRRGSRRLTNSSCPSDSNTASPKPICHE